MKTADKRVLTAAWRMWQGGIVSLVIAYGFAAANRWSCTDSFWSWSLCMIKRISEL